ncbi:hypothetical protein BDV29DRAFT_171681 [Aspergillus leporis]|uniref:RlpA-like double-psi beta-barrel-protein domain-containing protein-containing protein n=1 Tax=Aspergillus leporis TaxID=41062 RepID=A0A5N5X657_9EURO|nr:hypothetical protein BDV29DRAFT_171681 [Aspergillus leporis]
MAPLAKTLALAGALFAAIASTAPVQKRNEVAASTHTTVVWTTVTVTQTLTRDQPTETPAQPTIAPLPVTSATPTAAPQPSKPAEVPEEPEEPSETWESEGPTSTQAPVWTPSPAAQSTTATPEPLTTQEPEPTTTYTPPAAPTQATTTSQAPQPTATSGGGSSSGGSGYTGSCSKSSPCKGQITYYDTATSASAPSSCGWTNDGSTENVLALPVGLMKDSDCGRTVTIRYGGKTSTGKVVDKCMGCDSTSVDLSRHFFNELSSEVEGRLFGVEWYME